MLSCPPKMRAQNKDDWADFWIFNKLKKFHALTFGLRTERQVKLHAKLAEGFVLHAMVSGEMKFGGKTEIEHLPPVFLFSH